MNFIPAGNKRDHAIITAGFVISVAILISFYLTEYSKIQPTNIPLGWDTPSYAAKLKLIQEGQLMQVLKESDYVNFMYYILFSLIPISPLHVEMYLPIILAILAIVCFGAFSYVLTRNVIVTSSTMLIFSSSFGLLRITSDLHSQLLSIVLVFIAFILLLKYKDGKSKWSLLVPILVFISSFTHFENTFFLLVIFITAWFFVYRTKLLGTTFILLFIPMAPSVFMYVLHLFNAEYFPPNLQIANDPISYNFLLLSIGAFLPLLIAGIGASFYFVARQHSLREKKPVFFFIYFSLIWIGISLILFRQSYFTDTFYSFSYRAAVFLPLPFIGSIPFLLIDSGIFKKITSANYVKYAVLSIVIVLSLCLYNISILFENEVEVGTITYLSHASFSQLLSLSNINLAKIPLLVLYPTIGDVSPGGMSFHIDNWVSVFYGPHDTYLGFVDSLLTNRETPFTDPYSKYYSYAFNRDLNRSDTWKGNISVERTPILVLENFYDVEQVRNNSRYTPIRDGIYLLSDQPNGTVSYRISSISPDPVGWYLTRFGNVTMIESYQPVDRQSQLNMTLPLNLGSCYTVETKYLDASKGLGHRVSSNNKIIHTTYYEGGGTLNNDSFKYCASDRFTQFSIEPVSNPMFPTVDRYFTSIANTLTVRYSP